MFFLADLDVSSLAELLARVVADEVSMIEVCRSCPKAKQKQWLSLCIPSGEALATELGLVLGQEKVASKSNEITAIPELLKALYINGLLVSIDAMGRQKSFARQITDQGGDYLLAVKGNQPSLLAAIEAEFIDQYQSEEVDRHRQVHKAHGRIVAQIAAVLPAKGVVDLAGWPKCKRIGLIDSLRKIGDNESKLERRYYIISRELTAKELAAAARSH